MPFPTASSRGRTANKPRVGEITLPQNLVTSAGTVLDNCDATTDWAAAAGSVALDETVYRSGAAIKLTTALGNGRARKTCSWDLSNGSSCVRLWVYKHDTNFDSSLYLYAATVSNFSKYFVWSVSAGSLVLGWNCISVARSEWSNNGGASWTDPIVRFDIQITTTGAVGEITFDDIRGGVSTVAAALFTFDDADSRVYSNAYAYMQPKGIPGTFYVNTDFVDTLTYVTSANLLTMQAGGWSIGNHTDDHTNLTTLNQADQQLRIGAARDALNGWGLTAGAHVSYPFGVYNADTLLAMAAESMLTGRIGSDRSFIMPPDNHYLFPNRDLSFYSEAQNKAYLLQRKARGEIAILLMHIPSGADLQLLQNIVNYTISQEIVPLTIEQLYALKSGPLTVSVPW